MNIPENQNSDARLQWRSYVLRQCPLIPNAVKLFALTMAEYSANGERCHPGWELLKREAGYAKSTTYSLENACIAWGILRRDGGPHQFSISLPPDADIEWPRPASSAQWPRPAQDDDRDASGMYIPSWHRELPTEEEFPVETDAADLDPDADPWGNAPIES